LQRRFSIFHYCLVVVHKFCCGLRGRYVDQSLVKFFSLKFNNVRPKLESSNSDTSIFWAYFFNFCYFAAQKVNIYGKFFELRPKDEFGLATPSVKNEKNVTKRWVDKVSFCHGNPMRFSNWMNCSEHITNNKNWPN
jgi:hypothetical protein